MENSAKHPKFVRWAVVLGIVIVLNIFFLVIRAIAFPAPDIATYCPNANQPAPPTEQGCASLGGVWTDYGADVSGGQGAKPVMGYCDLYSGCQPAYQAAQDKYDMYAFALMIALGVIALLVGVLAPVGSSIVSSGLSFGGVLALIIASASYWTEAGNWLRLAISVIALVALLYLGIKKFRD